MLIAAKWMKANMNEEDEDDRATAGGYPGRWHTLNKGAGRLATRGIAEHTEGPKFWKNRQWDVHKIARYLRHRMGIYKLDL